MRVILKPVILKPAGLLVILGAFCVLTVIAFWRYKPGDNGAGAAPGASAAAAAAARTAAASATAPPPPSGSTASPFAVSPSAAPRPAGVLLAPDIASEAWKLLVSNPPTENMTTSVVDASVPGHPRARRFTITAVGENFWGLQVAHTLDAPFQKGKRYRLTYWARSKDSCPMLTVVEQSEEPYAKIVTKEERLTPEWKQYSEEWVQESDTPPGWAKVDFQVGYKVGQIEVTGVILRVVN